jgi:hypothetical protein
LSLGVHSHFDSGAPVSRLNVLEYNTIGRRQINSDFL